MANQVIISKFLKDMHKYYTSTGDNGRSISYGNAYSGWKDSTDEDMSVDELISLVESDEIPGFGSGTKSKVLTLLDDQPLPVYEEVLASLYGKQSSALKEDDPKILPQDSINEVLNKLVQILNNNNISYDISGSFRRGIYTSEIEILSYDKDKFESLKVIFKDSIIESNNKRLKLNLNNIIINIRNLTINERGCALIYYTGSNNFNIRMRKYAKSKGMSLSESNLTTESGQISFKTEEELFSYLGLNYIEPKDRS